jgi:hypothetical protein
MLPQATKAPGRQPIWNTHKSPFAGAFVLSSKLLFVCAKKLGIGCANRNFYPPDFLWKKMWITFGKLAQKPHYLQLPSAFRSGRRYKPLFIS